MNIYTKIHYMSAFAVWAIASFVYIYTLEPGVSFWDCGEFIASGYGLQIGHPPGAPLYMLLARFFSLFTGGNPEIVAYSINLLSALASSCTILFLYLSVTHIAQRIGVSKTPSFLPIGAGIIAALSFTFTDSFWFSAVESEVYALSTLLTAVVLWAILQWEKSSNTKWLVLIAFLMGLSVGVHLLNLLAIPALCIIYYFKKNHPSRIGVIQTFLVSLAMLAGIHWIVIPGLIYTAAWWELLLVNRLSLPIHSGLISYILLVFFTASLGLYITHVRNKRILHYAILTCTMFILGYSVYGVVIIRSTAQPPMNENNPSNAFALGSYISRDQYTASPLVWGQTYNAPIVDYRKGKRIYTVQNNRYEHIHTESIAKYDRNFTHFFPRMWSSQPHHVEEYKKWADISDGKNTRPMYVYGQTFHTPSFFQNLKFFINYQVIHMYFRYFMWNFTGKQNDLQGNGEPHKGNWISGISIIDNLRLGPQDALPQYLQNNKARNTYFAIPLLLGLIGFVFVWRKHKQYAMALTFLFVFTGLAIVLYLNQTPLEPRERDYAYVGSFYVFSMWIGFSVLALYSLLQKYFNKRIYLTTFTITALCPILLATENWDDHNRRNRQIARDFSKNYLKSCLPNAILFTYGDNDTFPLWYLQKVEGFRNDVRVINVSLLQTQWYIESIRKKAYESDAIALSIPAKKYQTGTNEHMFILVNSKLAHTVYPLQDIIEIIASNDPNYKAINANKQYIDYIPAPLVMIPVNTQYAIKSGIISANDSIHVTQFIPFSPVSRNEQGLVQDSIITKSQLAILDILANFEWKRPIHFSSTLSSEYMMNLHNFLHLQGLAYTLKPIKNVAYSDFYGGIDTKTMYQNLMHTYQWGNSNNPSVYVDEHMQYMIRNYKNLFGALASKLVEEHENSRAQKVLNKCNELFPPQLYPHDYFSIPLANSYFALGDSTRAFAIYNDIFNSTNNNFIYYMSVKASKKQRIESEVMHHVGVAIELFETVYNANHHTLTHSIAVSTAAFMEQYFSFTRQISLCMPEEFEAKNGWIFQLPGNLPYIAYWYNTLKLYASFQHEASLQ